MHLTQADIRAAREGFRFVVVRGGKRVAYTTTKAEAKREGGTVYALAKARYTTRNPMSFAKWLDTFLEEKEIDPEEVLEVKGKQWGTNYIPVGVLVQAMKQAPKHEQEGIKTMLVKIDFHNAPVRPYLAHLGQAIARNPAGKGKAKLRSLDREIARREAAGMPVAYLLEQRDLLAKRRNPTAAYHRSRGEAEMVLAEDSYRKAGALRKRGDASGSHDALIHAHRMAALAEADLLDGASPKAAEAKRLAWWKAYSALAADHRKKRNPGLTPAGKRHLIQTMHKAGADTFTKKMRYVRRHMPHVTDPAAFVGYIMQGEKR